VCAGLNCLRTGSSGRLLKHSNKFQVCKKGQKFLDPLSAISFSRRTLLHGVGQGEYNAYSMTLSILHFTSLYKIILLQQVYKFHLEVSSQQVCCKMVSDFWKLFLFDTGKKMDCMFSVVKSYCQRMKLM
jgi:hypothetical protein